uniref:Uncharacterized protein n=1 Tax=Cyprinus carpio TaxID=7962 RepID=A0A8C2GW35_CYPCA
EPHSYFQKVISSILNCNIDISFTMAVYVIRKEGGHHKPPADIGVVIKAVKVLNELPSFTSACALLLGMIYINNLAYPKPLRFTFEVFQKVLLQLDQHKMSPKVQRNIIFLGVTN